LKLGKLIYLYDDNHISIEGSTDLAFTEDRAARFEAYGWHTCSVPDGNNLDAIEEAIRSARSETERPSLILIRTHIGYGSPKQDSAGAHGEPLGADAARATREFFQWPAEPTFFVPEEVAAFMGQAVERGVKWEQEWLNLVARYRAQFPAEADRLQGQFRGELPRQWDAEIPRFRPEDGPIETRAASGKVLNCIAHCVPNLLGGSADLAPSTKTLISGSGNQEFGNPGGRNFRFGVREHAMGAMVNGMAAHGGVIPYGATFLIFSDYMRPAIRLCALMDLHSIFVFTHDSLGVGEDGPTHQPVEQLASLRAVPNLFVIRPADANETAVAWKIAMQLGKPVALALTRQKLPVLDQDRYAGPDGLAKGAYVLADVDGRPDLILIASGSEVSLALHAREALEAQKGIKARVVSMPCWELFECQPREYRDHVLPPQIKARLSIEAGCSLGWSRWVGDAGESIAVERFGASAPGQLVLEQYGFNVDNVVARATALVSR
jgi:transketolase